MARPSIQRDAVALAFCLNLARYSVRFPFTFQKSLQILLANRHPRRDNVVEYFRRRKFRAQRIRYSSAELVEWLSKVVVSTRSYALSSPSHRSNNSQMEYRTYPATSRQFLNLDVHPQKSSCPRPRSANTESNQRMSTPR